MSDYRLELGPDRTIRGTLSLPPEECWPAPVVLFCHGFKGFKDWGPWPWFAERLAAAGFLVNRFNFSLSGVGPALDRHDEPEKFSRNTYAEELYDLSQILDRREGWGAPAAALGDRCGLVGHSRGGMVGLLFGAEDRRVDALVTLGSPGRADRFPLTIKDSWRAQGYHEIVNQRTGEVLRLGVEVLDDFEVHGERYDVARAVAARAVPTLVVHGEADESVPAVESEWIEAAFVHDRSRRERVPGTGHTFGAGHPFEKPEAALKGVLDLTIDFLREELCG